MSDGYGIHCNYSMPKGDPDLLFSEDGSVRLPKLTGLALKWAASGHGCASRQPTRERAEAVAEALQSKAAERGLTLEVRPGVKTETFGVYVHPNARDALTETRQAVDVSARTDTAPT